MPRKPKTNQPQTPDKVQGRDFFQTPNYAVDLLVPFIPKRKIYYFWEPAAGDGKISKRLMQLGLKATVWSTDIKDGSFVHENNLLNFVGEKHPFYWIKQKKNPIIITNPPFSLKRQFYERCLEYNVPFALLLPFDMCQWIAEAFDKDGIQALVPNRRIDYITPNGNSGKTSSSQFHSFWLTWGFNLPKQITVVELSLKEKKENI